MDDVALASFFFFSALSGLISANATRCAILLLTLVGVTAGVATLGVLGFDGVFGLVSGLLAGLAAAFLGFAFLPGLRPLERLLVACRLGA